MFWYVQLIIYLVALAFSFIAMWQVDFHRFIRKERINLAIFVYIILSLAIGFLIGKLFIELGTLMNSAAN